MPLVSVAQEPIVEPVDFHELALPRTTRPYLARLFIGMVLDTELSAVLVPPIFKGTKLSQHHQLCKLAASVLRKTNPGLRVKEKSLEVNEPILDGSEGRGLHIDGNIFTRRTLRVHTNRGRGSTNAFANSANNYVTTLQSDGSIRASGVVQFDTERLYRQGKVNPDLVSTDFYIGDQPADYSIVMGIGGPKDVWHRFETIAEETNSDPRYITITDIFYDES